MNNFNFNIKSENLLVSGESITGEFCSGSGVLFAVDDINNSWIADILYTTWENEEEEIVVKNVCDERMGALRNRLRMGISKCKLPEYPNSKICTLRTANIKQNGSSIWANLVNTSIGELSEMTVIDPMMYFKRLGALNLDYKLDLMDQGGVTSKQLLLVFPSDNMQVPINAFIITRIWPFYLFIANNPI